jgi:AraC-like DNA-binding protein
MITPSIQQPSQVKVGEGDLKIASDYLILLLELGLELGLKQSDLLLDSQLDASIFIRPGIYVGDRSFLKVVANFRKQQPDMAVAVTYGKRMTLSKHGALGIAARHSRTTNDAATAVISYMRTRVELFSVHRQRDAINRRLYVDLEVESSDEIYFLILAYLTSIEFILRQMLSCPDEIKTRIELPIKPEYWQGKKLTSNTVILDPLALGSEIKFSSERCMLLWPTQYLNDLLPLFDQSLVKMAQDICEVELKSMSNLLSINQVVKQAFNDVNGHLPTIDSIASTLNTSSATLKRKLKAEGYSFREIKDEILHKKANELLTQTGHSIERIAEKLGYSDASNFSKAFKGWSGITPSEFRQLSLSHHGS